MVRTIHFLLHVVDGVVSELEIYKDDSSAIVAVPNADKLDLILLPPPLKVTAAVDPELREIGRPTAAGMR